MTTDRRVARRVARPLPKTSAAGTRKTEPEKRRSLPMTTAVRGLSRFFVLPSVLLAASLVHPAGAWAQAQTDAQQDCANGLLKQAVKIGKTQTKANSSCLKSSQASDEASLGLITQAQTADGCLTNDQKGKHAKAKDKAADIVSGCAATPTFGSTLGKSAGAADAGARAAVRDIFGLNVDELWHLLSYDDE